MDYCHDIAMLEAAALVFALATATLCAIAHRSCFLPRAIQWLRRDPLMRGLLVALLLAIGPITARTKNGMLSLPRPPAILTGETPSPTPPFVCYEARTNGISMVAPTTNAVVSESCLRCGTSEGGEWVELDAPFFRWGTNDIRRLYASPGCLSFGTMRHPYLGDPLPNGTDAESLVVLRMPLGIVPEANWHLLEGTGVVSRFWHDSLPGGGRVFTWENALLDRLADRPASIQAELRPNGDFIYRYDFTQAVPTNVFFIGAQKAEAAVEALRVGPLTEGAPGGAGWGCLTNSATIWRIDGTTDTNGVSLADLFASSPLVELRWRNVSDLGDLSLDPDGDGISSHDEIFLYGTEPLFADTDADGIADNIELMMGTDPFDTDEDGNGIPDGITAADWAANPLHAAVAGSTNTVLRVLQVAAPGTSAFVSIGSLTIPLSAVRDIPLALPVDEPVSIGVVSFGDSGARIALSGPENTPTMRGGGIHGGGTRSGGAPTEPTGGLLLDSRGLFSGQPLFETRGEAVYILLTRLDLAQLDGYASECVHKVPGIRRFCPVLPTGFWPAMRGSATIAGFQVDGDALTLTVADWPRSIATGTISFSPPALVWGELSAYARIHRCEASGAPPSGCDLCWEWYGVDHDTRDFPLHLQNHALAVQHDSTPWPELSLTDDSVPAVWSVSPSGGVQLHVMGSGGQPTPYTPGAEVSSVLVDPGSTPGVYMVSVRHPLDDEDADSAEVIVFRVDHIEVSSDKLGESPNPPPFAGEREWAFSPTNSPYTDKHAAVFFRDVTSPTNEFAVQPFDVTFRAVLFPSVPPALLPSTQWTRIEGPDSGTLVVDNPLEAVLRNPAQGGVYRLSFEACSDGPHPSEATLVLPLAGATVDGLMQDEIGWADTFVSIAVTNFSPDIIQSPSFGKRWFVDSGYGDHLGRPNSTNSPAVWYYGQIDDISYLGGTATWCGLPVRCAKMSNFIVGYATTRLGVSPERRWLAQFVGTSNDNSATLSWEAGCNVATGAVYSVTVSNLVHAIWDPDDPKVGRSWPNLATLDNLIPPNLAWNMNYYFCTPFFLYVPPVPNP